MRFNNVTLNGTYTISNVTANTYSIRAPNNPNATGSGGGLNVVETHTGTSTIQVGDFGWYEYQANPDFAAVDLRVRWQLRLALAARPRPSSATSPTGTATTAPAC